MDHRRSGFGLMMKRRVLRALPVLFSCFAILALVRQSSVHAAQGNPVYTAIPPYPVQGGACTGTRNQIQGDDGTVWCCVASQWDKCGGGGGSYDLLFWFPAISSPSQTLVSVVMSRAIDFPQNCPSSRAFAAVPSAGADPRVLQLQKNGVQFGTITFTIGQEVGTVACAAATSFAIGDRFTVVAPATLDSALAKISFTLPGVEP